MPAGHPDSIRSQLQPLARYGSKDLIIYLHSSESLDLFSDDFLVTFVAFVIRGHNKKFKLNLGFKLEILLVYL